jgi:hypothetical protein
LTDQPKSPAPKRARGRPTGSKTETALDTPTQVRREMILVYRRAKSKKLDSLDGVRLTNILKEILSCIRNGDLEERLAVLEEKLNGHH